MKEDEKKVLITLVECLSLTRNYTLPSLLGDYLKGSLTIEELDEELIGFITDFRQIEKGEDDESPTYKEFISIGCEFFLSHSIVGVSVDDFYDFNSNSQKFTIKVTVVIAKSPSVKTIIFDNKKERDHQLLLFQDKLSLTGCRFS